MDIVLVIHEESWISCDCLFFLVMKCDTFTLKSMSNCSQVCINPIIDFLFILSVNGSGDTNLIVSMVERLVAVFGCDHQSFADNLFMVLLIFKHFPCGHLVCGRFGQDHVSC